MGLLNLLRKIGDPSGGKWVGSHRHSSWVSVGELNIGTNYVAVSYSKESLMNFANNCTYIIFRSQDMTKLKNFYFGAMIDEDKKAVRVMGFRTENLFDQYLDEKIFTLNDCFDVSFSNLPNLTPHLEEIQLIGNSNGHLESFNSKSWFDELTKLVMK